MKLYRGLKSSEFKMFSEDAALELRNLWSAVLNKRSKGDWTFPNELNEDILLGEKLLRLQRQHFTDRRDIALGYATENNGALIEIDVSKKDILDHFRIEFQNFGKRKKSFEIVYVIDSSILFRNRRKWKLKQLPNIGEL